MLQKLCENSVKTFVRIFDDGHKVFLVIFVQSFHCAILYNRASCSTENTPCITIGKKSERTDCIACTIPLLCITMGKRVVDQVVSSPLFCNFNEAKFNSGFMQCLFQKRKHYQKIDRCFDGWMDRRTNLVHWHE